MYLKASLNACKKMRNMFDQIRESMRTNVVKLNDKKTEILLISTPYVTDDLHETQLRIVDAGVQGSESARNLGVIF